MQGEGKNSGIAFIFYLIPCRWNLNIHHFFVVEVSKLDVCARQGTN